RKGSGYVAHHGKDFLTCPDPWFRPLALLYGPDGGVYLSDWHDTGECHNYEKTHPSGRIYKITYGKPKKVEVDLAKLSDDELAKLQTHKNEWHARQGRRLLQERAYARGLDAKVKPALLGMLRESKEVSQRLRALWDLHCITNLDEKQFLQLLERGVEDDLRAWAVRLWADEFRLPSEVYSRLLGMAALPSTSLQVELALAAAAQRLPMSARLELALNISTDRRNAQDANLPLLIWYAVEPVPDYKWSWTEELLMSDIPLLSQYVARRTAELDDRRRGQ